MKGLRTLEHTHLHTNKHTSCISGNFRWRIHCSVEVTELRTNKQHSLSVLTCLCRQAFFSLSHEVTRVTFSVMTS
jgi:hypothetical protein